jgi:tRNA modification GTPase
MSAIFDTVVAPITGSQPAPVAIVRLSGPESWAIASRIFNEWPTDPKTHVAVYGRFCTGDDGLCLPFESGHGFTGEQSVEMSVHGSRPAVAALVEACIAQGARRARPGEFTESAFLNGRLDLTQAEGVRDTVEALTSRQFRHANLVREGAIRSKVRAVRDKVAGVMAAVEASVDFSEEIGDLDRPSAAANLERAETEIAMLLATAPFGHIVRRGLRIAIIGPPNAGKSSLLNALAGFERAIVTEVPGTTRDVLEETIELAGVPCVVSDTAGLRETEDLVERIGVDRARTSASAADLVWYVFDGAAGWTEADEHAMEGMEDPWLLANKSDLPAGAMPHRKIIRISARTGEGLKDLEDAVGEMLGEPGMEDVWIDERHEPLLRSASSHLAEARRCILSDLPFDLAVVHLQAALTDLGQITGESASSDMLERIFRDFCVGK